MYAQYRYKGRFIDAAAAQRLSNLKSTKDYISTSIRETPRGKPVLETPGHLTGTTLKTVYAMESDRRRREEERSRRIEREKGKTMAFKKAQAEQEEPPDRPSRPIESYYPEDRYSPDDDEDEERPDVYLPYDEIPDEDDYMDDYFDDAIEVADIDSDIYIGD